MKCAKQQVNLPVIQVGWGNDSVSVVQIKLTTVFSAQADQDSRNTDSSNRQTSTTDVKVVLFRCKMISDNKLLSVHGL